jgi:hypothetical protein
MVDETLSDQVWVTVVATRYGGAPPAKRLQEPMGEPRVERRTPRPPAPPRPQAPARPQAPVPQPAYRGPERSDYRRVVPDHERPRDWERDRAPEPESVRSRGGGLSVSELDVPEFLPRGR